MTKTSKLLSYILLALLIIFIAIIWKTKLVSDHAPVSNDSIYDAQSFQVDFLFDNTQAISLQYPYSTDQDISLLDITTALAKQENWQFAAEDYGDLGILVTQIGDKKNGQDQQYWQFYANDKMPMLSVDKYLPRASDHLQWKFQIS